MQFAKVSTVLALTAAVATGAAVILTSPLPAHGASQTPPATTPAPSHGHEHKPGEGHKEDEHKGPKTELGTKKISGYDVKVTQQGEVKPGEEAVFIVKVSGGTGEPKAVRAWVGVEAGTGSIKTKAEEEKEGEWHAHHTVSKPIPKAAKLWLEVETAAGKKRESFDVKLGA